MPHATRSIARRSAVAWLVFFAGFALEMILDFSTRRLTATRHGVPEPLWFAIQLALAALAAWLAFRATRPMRSPLLRGAVVCVQLAIGFCLYAVASLYYVCAAGIDCL